MGNTSSTPVVKRKCANKSNNIKYCKSKIVQNFALIWLDSNINTMQKDGQYTISELNKVYNSITLFTDLDECRKFIEKPREEQIFLIVSGKLGEQLVPLVHKYTRLDSIYVFCGHPPSHPWTKEWRKIKIVSKEIEPICQLLVLDAAQCENDLTPTSILSLNASSNQDLEQLDASFMYSQLIKEILLEIKYDKRALFELAAFCRPSYEENQAQLRIIDEFETDYDKHTPIWWYTRECFAYRMLNRSLRTFDIEVIAAMGFFMKDIHTQIKEIHSKLPKRTGSFMVYRGQGMLMDEFEALKKNIGGYFSFNSFLSTSEDLNVAMVFVKKTLNRDGKVSILFEIEIDPTTISTPFAPVDEINTCQKKEREIIFSMHTVFQIIQVKETDNHIWTVKLKSISDSDLKLKQLTEHIRRGLSDGHPIDRLGRLMITLDEIEKAEAIYLLLRDSTPDHERQALACINCQLGYLKYKQNIHSEAKQLYLAAIEIQEKLNPATNLNLAATYTNMGLLCTDLNDTSDALSYHQKALAIREKNTDVNLADLGSTYNNIGLVHDKRKEFSLALTRYERALHLFKQTLPANHPWLATTYKNIGLAQISLGNLQEGLDHLFKAKEIRKIAFPSNHPSIASVCSTIGDVYFEQKDYKNALKYYEEALYIEQRASNINHSNLAYCYYTISKVLNNLEEHSKAFENAKLAVQAINKSTTSNQKDLEKITKHFEQLQTNRL